MNFNINKTNKVNNIDSNKKKRGRPKKIEIAKPSTKKRGRPRKYPVQPPKPVGRNGKPKKTKEEIELEALERKKAKQLAKEKEQENKNEALTAKQIEEKFKKETKVRSRNERKMMQVGEFGGEYSYTPPKTKNQIVSLKKLLLLLLLIAFIVSSFTVIKWYNSTSNAQKKYEDIASRVVLVNSNITKVDKNSNEDISVFDTVNFQELKTINAEAVAWVKINDTKINYPVLQATNNEYYLDYDIHKKKDSSGAIYMDYQNDKRIVDKNTVIYGHHIKKGTMFADLEKIAAGDLGNNVDVYIYTPEKSMRFKVFSAYTTIPEEFSINTEITEKDYEPYVEKLKEKSEKEFIGDPIKSNQIVTLSTCDKSGKERIVVHAELEDIE